MTFSQLFARLVALVGAGAVALRRLQGVPATAAFGATPEIPDGKPQGKIPTLKMPTAKGWADGQLPVAAPGLRVNAFARGLDHPRWIHVLPNGDVLVPAGTLPGFGDGMAIGQHGSWNRSTMSGYKLIFVPFENGKPSGSPRDILSGFLSADEKASYGRPVGVTIGPDGAVLMADDVGDVIWRVTAA